MTGAPLERMRAVRRRGEVLRGSLAVAGALTIVLAIPLAVLFVVGVPLPNGEPGGLLHQDRTAMYAAQGAACLLLLCWLQLTTCLVVEAVAGLRGSGLPRRVPFAFGVQQDLARALVTPALLIRGGHHGLRSAQLSAPPNAMWSTPAPAPVPGSAWPTTAPSGPAPSPPPPPPVMPLSPPASAATPTSPTPTPAPAAPPSGTGVSSAPSSPDVPPPTPPSSPAPDATGSAPQPAPPSLPPPTMQEVPPAGPNPTAVPASPEPAAATSTAPEAVEPEPAAPVSAEPVEPVRSAEPDGAPAVSRVAEPERSTEDEPPAEVPESADALAPASTEPPHQTVVPAVDPPVSSAAPVEKPAAPAPPTEPVPAHESMPALSSLPAEESASTSEQPVEPVADQPVELVDEGTGEAEPSGTDQAQPPQTEPERSAVPPTAAPTPPDPAPAAPSTPVGNPAPQSATPTPAPTPPPAPVPAATSAPAPPPRPEPASVPGPPSAPAVAPVPAAASAAAAVPAGRAVDVPWDLAGAGLLCAGLLDVVGERRWAQARTRRPGAPVSAPDPEAASVDMAIRLGADPAATAFVDQALRALADGVVQQECPIPEIYAARLSGQYLDLFLAAPVAQAPAPFRAEAGGGRWRISREIALPKMDGVPAPLPAMVCLGSSQGSRLLVDLESMGGPVSVDGDRDRARSVVVAAALELATSPFGDDVHVTLVGFGHVVDSIDPERLHCVDSLDDALDAVCARLDRLHRTLAGVGSGSLLVGRMRVARAVGRSRPGQDVGLDVGPDTGAGSGSVGAELIMLASPPTPAQYARLHAQARRFRRAPFGLLTAGSLPPARLRLTVDAAGALDTGPLGVTVAAQLLSPRTYLALGRLMRSVSQPDTEVPPAAPADDISDTAGGVAATTGAAAEPDESKQDGSVSLALSAPTRAAALRRAAELDRSPQVLVRLFGEPTLELTGPRPPAASPVPAPTPLTVEICLCVALAGELALPRLAASVWPAGVGVAELTDAVEAATAFLGTNEEGAPRLRLVDGVLSLSEEVGLDWYRFVALVTRGGAGDVDRALQLVRGAPAEPTAPGRYAWLAREPVVREARAHVVDVAHRQARLCLARGDHDGAVAAARAGLRAEPVSNALWDDLAAAIRERDGAAAAEELLRTRGPR